MSPKAQEHKLVTYTFKSSAKGKEALQHHFHFWYSSKVQSMILQASCYSKPTWCFRDLIFFLFLHKSKTADVCGGAKWKLNSRVMRTFGTPIYYKLHLRIQMKHSVQKFPKKYQQHLFSNVHILDFSWERLLHMKTKSLKMHKNAISIQSFGYKYPPSIVLHEQFSNLFVPEPFLHYWIRINPLIVLYIFCTTEWQLHMTYENYIYTLIYFN